MKKLSWLLSLSLAFTALCSLPARASTATYVQSCLASPAGQTTSQTVTCGVSPTAGDEFYAFISINHTSPAVTTPTGTWNLIDTCVNGTDTMKVYTHTVTSGDASSNSFAWSWGATPYYAQLNINEFSGTNTSSPVDAHMCTTRAAGTAPQTVTSGAPNLAQIGDIPLFTSLENNTATAPTAGSSSGGSSGACTRIVAGNTGGIYQAQETCPAGTGSPGASLNATFVYPVVSTGGYDTEIILIPPGGTTNGSGLAHAGGPHTPVTQNIGATIPALSPYMVWYDEPTVQSNTNTTSTQDGQFLLWCLGFGRNSVNINITTACQKTWLYATINMAQPNSNGHDVDWPFEGAYTAAAGQTTGNVDGTCPASSSNFFKTTFTFNGVTIPDYTSTNNHNWFTYVNTTGTSIGNLAFMGGGYRTTSQYYIWTNVTSPTLIDYVQQTISYCADTKSGANQDYNSFTGNFIDNTFWGIMADGGTIWDTYNTGKNFYTSSTYPYVDFTYGQSGTSFNPGNFFTTVSTTSNTAVTGTMPASVTITPNSMTGINVGSTLQYDAGANLESIVVTAANSTTFTATFTKTHATGVTISNIWHTGINEIGGGGGTDSLLPYNTSTTSWSDSMYSLMSSFYHRDGVTPWYFISNGAFNSNPLFAKNPHNYGRMAEEMGFGFCSSTSSNSGVVGETYCQNRAAIGREASYDEIIDNAVTTHNDVLVPGINPNAHLVTLNDQPSTGVFAIGGASHQQDLRWDWLFRMFMSVDDFPNYIVSMRNACGENGGGTDPNCTDVWGDYWTMAASRYTAFPADPTPTYCGRYPGGTSYNFSGNACNAGGANDTHILCDGVTKDLFCAEFGSFSVFGLTTSGTCSTWDVRNWLSCAVQEGPLAIIINNTTSNITLSPTNLALYFPNTWTQLQGGHIVFLCTPAAGATNWTSGATTYVYRYDSGTTATQVCSGNTGNDLPNAGYTAPATSVDMSTATSTIQNDVLTPGQGVAFGL